MAARIYHADLWGLREDKYRTLLETYITTTDWAQLAPTSPFYFFVPREEKLRPEYEKGWKVTDIFPVNSTGIVTARDEFVIDFEPAPIRRRLEIFLDKSLGDVEVKEKLSLSENYAWRVSEARKQLMAVKKWESLFNKILYRPFDVRSIYYHPSVVWRTRTNVMGHMLAGENIALITSRMTKGETYQHTLVSKTISEVILLSPKTSNNAFVFPLYLYPAEGEMQFGEGHRRPNLNPEFIKTVSEKLGLNLLKTARETLSRLLVRRTSSTMRMLSSIRLPIAPATLSS